MKPSTYQPNTPGMFRMPADEYHAAPGVSKHALDYVNECPRRLQVYRLHGQEPTDAMEKGSVFHTAVLEPEKLDGAYYIRPATYPGKDKKGFTVEKPWNGNATWCEDWLARHTDKPVFTLKEHANIADIRHSCQTHPILGPILESEHEVELSCFARCPHTGLLRKGRPDLITEDTGGQLWIVDLKFVADAGKDSFQRQAQDLRYFVQAAYYIDLLELLGFPGARFLFAAVEKDPIHPDDHQHIVRCFEIPPADIVNARGHYIRDLHRFKQCLDSGEWPDDTDKIQSLEMSSYYRKANAI